MADTEDMTTTIQNALNEAARAMKQVADGMERHGRVCEQESAWQAIAGCLLRSNAKALGGASREFAAMQRPAPAPKWRPASHKPEHGKAIPLLTIDKRFAEPRFRSGYMTRRNGWCHDGPLYETVAAWLDAPLPDRAEPYRLLAAETETGEAT